MPMRSSFIVVLAILVTGLSAQGSLKSSLSGYWPLDGNVNDFSGHGRHGVIVGGPTFVPGHYGEALNFDGTSDYVDVPDHEGFLVPHWCVSSWVNTTTAGNLDILSWGTEGGGLKVEFRLHDGRPRIEHGNGNHRADIQVHDGEWHHLLAQLPDGGVMQDVVFYVDGVLMASFAVGNGTNPFIVTPDLPVNIGRSGPRGDRHFSGSIDEVRMYDRTLTEEEVLIVMEGGGGVSPELASAPNPADADPVADVVRDADLSWEPGEFAATHNVYLSTGFDDVNDGAAAALIAQGLTEPGFVTERFAFGQTYYWRVDEVNGAPDFAVFKGATWRFTVEPFSIPISAISVTASSFFGVSGPEKTIDGSGLVDDLHGSSAEDMWISSAIPATIEYAFDRAYKLNELWIWNSNQLIEPFVGFGAKDVVIEHSPDGENWTTLDGVGPLAGAPGTEGYAHNNTLDFGGAVAQHVRLTVNSVQGIAPQTSLSEVRFTYIPTFATRPNPESGATDVAPDSSLSWGRNGREADRHEVFIGSDPAALPSVATVNESSLDTLALDLQLSQTYHWRVDEINDVMDPGIWEGRVWNFTTADSISIDDMESYKDEEFFEIWATWVDGFDDPANGALVGNGAGGTPETGIVHGGNQSLPMSYGVDGAAQSEATRTFDAPMDWTGHGVQGLVLWFQGSPDNTGGVLYVRINDTRVPYDGDVSNLMSSQWSQWYVPLANVAGDLSRVNSLTIGIDGGGAGVVYVDDITLVASAP